MKPVPYVLAVVLGMLVIFATGYVGNVRLPCYAKADYKPGDCK